MDKAINGLILKSNRLLGANLVEQGLVSLNDLEAANEVFLDRRRQGDPRQASLLKILLNETRSLDENNLLSYQIEEVGLAAFSLGGYKMDESLALGIGVDVCWATWTLPLDVVEDVHFLASAYYLSPFVRKYWEDKLNAPLVWSVHPLVEINERFESLAQAAEGNGSQGVVAG